MRKIFPAILLLLIMLFPACQSQGTVNTAPSEAVKKPYIGFSAEHTEKLDLKNFTQVDQLVFESYEHRYSTYSDRIYYDNLGESDQTVYRILQYAMDHAYPCVLIDNRVMEGMEYSVEEILTFFSLDSAVVEQNLSWQFGTFTVTYTSGTRVAELQGVQLYINDFSQEKQRKKNQAIFRAEQILAEMPEKYATDKEKAQYIYTWLGKNTEYHQDTRRDDYADYLYDALCEGRTNCDGFANAFSLLCAMEGIRCVEKIHVPENGSAGHTWNVVSLDGVWYNVDATASREVLEQNQPETYLHFGFADRHQEYICKFADLLPQCTRNLFALYCHIEKLEDAPAQVKKGFEENQQTYLIVMVEPGALSQSLLEEIAKELGSSISTRHYILADGSALYCIYKR